MQENYDTNTTLAVDRKPDPDFLPFTNDFIFSLVMRDPTLCRELLALALPEGKVSVKPCAQKRRTGSLLTQTACPRCVQILRGICLEIALYYSFL